MGTGRVNVVPRVRLYISNRRHVSYGKPRDRRHTNSRKPKHTAKRTRTHAHPPVQHSQEITLNTISDTSYSNTHTPSLPIHSQIFLQFSSHNPHAETASTSSGNRPSQKSRSDSLQTHSCTHAPHVQSEIFVLHVARCGSLELCLTHASTGTLRRDAVCRVMTHTQNERHPSLFHMKHSKHAQYGTIRYTILHTAQHTSRKTSPFFMFSRFRGVLFLSNEKYTYFFTVTQATPFTERLLR